MSLPSYTIPPNFTQINFNQTVVQPTPTSEPITAILASLGIFFSSLLFLFLTFYFSPELKSFVRKLFKRS
ncbi:hypothetical protein [Sulfurisphaera ohwakuensis]|uniref:Uncharacterized protein n=1 Tax=Sulfurisphaera ohwakuensis TaxID=69656 RepID=A0A650CKL5_SULOH|nr:hypothetical protein [Sulfurisphaera ohwakuensis]MBB5255215.1 hypothetical protein [Sulfurisphaera ohwakuensis]QGR18235.1 hypothetical protein D1869_14340 [Sulfurisphaera ohwakuensis]